MSARAIRESAGLRWFGRRANDYGARLRAEAASALAVRRADQVEDSGGAVNRCPACRAQMRRWAVRWRAERDPDIRRTCLLAATRFRDECSHGVAR